MNYLKSCDPRFLGWCVIIRCYSEGYLEYNLIFLTTAIRLNIRYIFPDTSCKKMTDVLRRSQVLHHISFSNICYLQALPPFIQVFHCCFSFFNTEGLAKGISLYQLLSDSSYRLRQFSNLVLNAFEADALSTWPTRR